MGMAEAENGWANPAPAGLVALAMACFVFYALFTGKVEGSCVGLMGIWLLGGFVVQLSVGLIELREGNTTGGNVFTFFSAFFMLVTGLELVFKYFAAIHGWQFDPHIDGWAWLPLAISLVLWTPAYFKSPLIMSLLVVVLDVALMIVALKDLGVLAASWGPIAGNLLLVSGILGLYMAAAIVTNTAYGRNVFPMPGPLAK
jgi:hypothetical protein